MPTLPPFPNPINETAARVTAGEVVALNTIALGFGRSWLLPLVGADFVVRSVAGPRFSPLALVASGVVIPKLGLAPHPTAGPPKRFAAAIGAVLMTAASVLQLNGKSRRTVRGLLAVMILFPALEAFLNFCVACKVFGLMMRVNLVPEEVCEACSNLSLRRPPVTEGEEA